MKLIIRSGLVVDPSQSLESVCDLLITDGIITDIAPRIETPEARVLDARGCVVAPGFIDLHTHLREPGGEEAETIETGTRAAARGGFTSVCAMANTNPVNDNAAVTRFVREQAQSRGVVNVFPIGAITQGLRGEALADIGEMHEAGIVAISDDGQPVMNAQIMRRAMEYARQLSLPVIDHCEDKNVSAAGVMNEGYWSTLLGLKGISWAAEALHVARDILLAELTGAHVHIAHVSTAQSVRLIREAKRRGIHITCEVTPHHFTLTEEAVGTYNPHTKMNPPLRTGEDVEALLEGLADRTIDAIATDHAPHPDHEKMREYDAAPFGVVGLETAVSLALDRLVHSRRIGWRRLVELFSTAPAAILKLPRGTLRPGAVADITILDPHRRVVIDSRQFHSKSRNTPFEGWDLTGSVRATLVAGKIIYSSEIPPIASDARADEP